MMTVALPAAKVADFLQHDDVAVAAALSAETSVVAGPTAALASLHERLIVQDIACRLLPTSHAFHSDMMQPIAEQLHALLSSIKLNPPSIPYLSNLSGTWITKAQATDPNYWVRHTCQMVNFVASVDTLFEQSQEPYLMLEVGPGQSLGAFVRQHKACDVATGALILPTLRYHYDNQSDSAFLLTTVGKAWLGGASIDWKGFYTHEARRRVSLPTYAFERQRYWLDFNPEFFTFTRSKPETGKRSEAASWFYAPTWEQSPASRNAGIAQADSDDEMWLLFVDDAGVGDTCAQMLRASGRRVACVGIGDVVERISADKFLIPVDDLDGYRTVLQNIAATPTHIAHFWSVDQLPDGVTRAETFDAAQKRGFYSLMHLTKALGNHMEALRIWAITSNAQAVTGTETLAPEKATTLGIMHVIQQENLNIICNNVDLSCPLVQPWQREQLSTQLVADFTAEDPPSMIAYRGNTRWLQTFAQLHLDKDDESIWKPDGTYLIVGGLGDVGMAIGRHIAQEAQANIVLTTRRAFPEHAQWAEYSATQDDDTASKIKQFLAWEAKGADVQVVQADASNPEAISQLFAGLDAKEMSLSGVLYAAGISGDEYFVPVQEVTKAPCETHFRSKVHGLYVLEQALQGYQLDFCVIFSSISSVLGGLGFAGYAAANNFIDTFVEQHNQLSPQSWTAVNWDTWRTRADMHDELGATVAVYDMMPDEANSALERVIANCSLTRLVNSTGILEKRIDQWVRMVSVRQTTDGIEAAALHPRPELMTTFKESTNETEALIADVWQALLGIEPIGIYDNFFELGGHSLLATQITSRLRQLFQVHIPLAVTLASPTVAELALAVEMTIIEELEALPSDAVADMVLA